MKLNSILSIFTPKDAKFLPLLKETAAILVQASTQLEHFFAAPADQWKELATHIKAEEVKGDNTTGAIFKALNETFITPFDREDIHALADYMDDVIDVINRSAQKVLLYAPKHLPEYNRQMAALIRKGSEELQLAVDELVELRHNDKKIRQHCKEIKHIEEQADVVYEEGIISLFRGDFDAIELVKLKEIIQELEKAANKINNASKIIRTIIVKYA